MKKKFTVTISARISTHPESYGIGENLEVSEQITVEAKDFLRLCQILGQVHELAEKIRIENPNR